MYLLQGGKTYQLMKSLQFIFVIFFLVMFTANLFSQNEDSQSHPKLGVVLSGGGAKGIAHIGILKALEEEGLRPDYIAGTSMGSIIGGLYAIGYSADQLDTIVRSIDWDLVLSNNIPLNYIAYEEKEFYTRYLVELPIKGGRLKIPSGMIEGQMLSEILTHYTWPAVKYDSFDDFPIPFRCVATDVTTGQPIVFKDGTLSEALRASMAIPTAFTPANLDTTMAVDGGVVNNFPVEELFKMGADYVIGVNVSSGFKQVDELGSMAGILLQIAMIPGLEKLDSQIDKCDIYIKPDMKNYSTASFGNYEDILKQGYIAGDKYRPQFKSLAKKWNINPELLKRVSLDVDSITILFIDLKGNKYVSDNLILSKLGIHPGDKVSRREIEKGIRRVHGLTNFLKVVYRIKNLPGFSGYKLTLQMDEKPPISFKASVHWDNIFQVGFTSNITMRNILGKSTRAIFASDISKNPKFRFNFLKYMGKKESYAAQVNYDFLIEQIPYYEEGKLVDIDVNREHSTSLGFITTQSLKQSFYLGGNYSFINQKRKYSQLFYEGMDHLNISSISINLLYHANTLNSRNYPTRGREVAVFGNILLFSNYYMQFSDGVDYIDFPINGSDTNNLIPISQDDLNELWLKPLTPETYGLLQFGYKEYFQVLNNFQIYPAFDLGLTFAKDEAFYQDFRLGGTQRLRSSDVTFMGLNFAEKNYSNFLLGGIYFQNIFWNSVYLNYGVNMLLPYDFVSIDNLESFDFEKMIEDYSMIGYGSRITYKSFFGPITGGLSWNSRDAHLRYYLSIGLSFNYSD